MQDFIRHARSRPCSRFVLSMERTDQSVHRFVLCLHRSDSGLLLRRTAGLDCPGTLRPRISPPRGSSPRVPRRREVPVRQIPVQAPGDIEPARTIRATENFAAVWLVHLLPTADNETGISLANKDWTFNPAKQELTIKKLFDPKKLRVYAYGNKPENEARTFAQFLSRTAGDPNGPITLLPFESMKEITRIEIVRRSDYGRYDTSVLEKNTWRFDPKNRMLTLTSVPEEAYNIYLYGTRNIPRTFQYPQPIDPASIRCVISGRIGKEGVDYRFEESKNAIQVLNPDFDVMSDLPMLVTYQGFEEPGTAGLGNVHYGNLYELKPEIARYIRDVSDPWNPVPGKPEEYSIPKKWEGLIRYTRIPFVELVPVTDGKAGRFLKSGEFSFDSDNQLLTLSTPVSEEDYIVAAWGDIEPAQKE